MNLWIIHIFSYNYNRKYSQTCFQEREEFIMLKSKAYQFWFCTGSQDLYGDVCLAHVAEHSQKIVEALNQCHLVKSREANPTFDIGRDHFYD